MHQKESKLMLRNGSQHYVRQWIYFEKRKGSVPTGPYILHG